MKQGGWARGPVSTDTNSKASLLSAFPLPLGSNFLYRWDHRAQKAGSGACLRFRVLSCWDASSKSRSGVC